MINNNRIVPVTKTDLLTLIGTIMALAGTSFTALQAAVPGDFDLSGSGNVGNQLAAEPVRSLDFKSGVTAAVVYFIPAFNYEGFKVAGTKVETAGADVDADGCTLYTATLSGGTVTIAKKGL